MRKFTLAFGGSEKQRCHQSDIEKGRLECIKCTSNTLDEFFIQQQMNILHASFLPQKVKDVHMEIWQQRLNMFFGRECNT